ncbi:MAG TPA: sulfotransferase [Rhizomicrobium sp.]|jgi:tetratricopeptide (TPR) repeat protein|nr:sulfotransferase [Rhizomicrobium sp.]
MSSLDASAHANSTRESDPFAEAKGKLFPPLRNRKLDASADALAEGQITAAETLLSSYLAKKPNDAEALNLMADVARRTKRFEKAEKLLAKCVALAPGVNGYRYNYAIVLRVVHDMEGALGQLENLLAIDSTNILFRDQAATVLIWLGRHTEALGLRQKLVEDFPRSPDLWLRYAHVLRDTGFREECIAAFHEALALAPSCVAAWGGMANLKVYRFAPEEIERMEVLSRSSGLSTDDRAILHHALGTAYGGAGLYGKSFENFARGNALHRLKVDFDEHRLETNRLTIERLFDAQFFADRQDWGCTSFAPIFIVGMPRSGTTLLEQILSSHSQIDGLGECADLDVALLRPLAQQNIPTGHFANGNAVDKGALANAYAEIIDRLGAEGFRDLGEDYLAVTGRSRATPRPHFTDKTLRNFFYIGLIHLMLPNAKIIDARRHPLDCGWSCFRSQFQGMNFAFRLTDIGQDYTNYVKLLAHFDRVLPGRIHRVIYERLITDPETELRHLFAYLGVPFEDACLHFHENRRTVMTQSSEQVRQPLYSSGIAQWVYYEPWLGPLKTALGPVLDYYPDSPPPG